ncbi:hypothetical protein RCF27_09295 [Rhodococcus pyridinivorans]|uniref:hypothetical protein n=1 Tax=Rhodococcus pyridinivorans TaxID=103816 RepID=UPI00280B7045|nr:hypothetical protein [Rhodococcus pyridinivorans]WMM74453.1 hypothetical protein RCF27_09295 [Rhodococcus pyridinivorans]
MAVARSWSAIVVAGVLGMAISGCSSGSDTPDATEDPVAALEAAATEWSESFYGGDSSEAYDLFTDECKDTFSEDEFKALSDFNQADGATRTLTGVTAQVEGDRGFADLTYANADNNDTNMPWVLVDGEWKTSDCTMRE